MVTFQVVYCRSDELISNCTSADFVPSSVLCTKVTEVNRPKSLIPWAYIREVMGDKLVNESMNRIISDSEKGEDKLRCSARGWEGEANGGKLWSDVLGCDLGPQTWVAKWKQPWPLGPELSKRRTYWSRIRCDVCIRQRKPGPMEWGVGGDTSSQWGYR